MMKGGGRERSGALAAANLVPQFHFISSLLLFNFILHFVKILTSRSISFSIFSLPTYAGQFTSFYPPPRNSNTYVPITFFFCLQKSSASGTMERRIKCLCIGKQLQKYPHGRSDENNFKKIRIIKILQMRKNQQHGRLPGHLSAAHSTLVSLRYGPQSNAIVLSLA